jgi:hypothetical protein
LKTSFYASSLSIWSRAESYGQAVTSVKEYTRSTCEVQLVFCVLSSLLKRTKVADHFRQRKVSAKTPFPGWRHCHSLCPRQRIHFGTARSLAVLKQSLLGRIEGGTRGSIVRISQCHCEKTPTVFQLRPLAFTMTLVVSSGAATIDSQSERKSHSNVSVNLQLLLHYYILLWI